MPEWTEAAVLQALANRHAGDIFVDHCKTGASFGFGPGLSILDAWVMPRSWVKPIVAYEVKVSRGDFLRDVKWNGYLEFCDLFYFATPPGLILAPEVPAGAGLVWVTKDGQSVRSVKRAPVRPRAVIPSSIFQYVLMWRAEVRRTILPGDPLLEFQQQELSEAPDADL